ncbi:PIR protein [Plasmodium malariae]|uniref:PIR Superfamily Protein n=1 Tax=Plasmodium malariae TaxID=5858 RepID=A0A1A8X897_PLAMA|nr:PIR protein [Plasmodium malariae]SBT01467.1 PIR Superfamily Protein [Plasmodium malariae]SBT85586.1 PIR protein [Plasmodium malariae]
MEESAYDTILQKLPSHEIYDAFNKEVTDTQYNSLCNIFNSVKDDYKNKTIDLCKKFARNLENLSKISTSGNKYDSCSHYVYWVYDEIRKLFKKEASTDDVATIIKNFNILNTSFITKYAVFNCNYYFLYNDLSELDNKREEKYLHDYFKNYSSIKSSANCKSVGIDDYKKYLKAVTDIYEREKKNCCFHGISLCQSYFLNCSDNLDPSKLIYALESTSADCRKLDNISNTETEKEKLDSREFEEFLKSINFTSCPGLVSDEPSTSTRISTSGDGISSESNIKTHSCSLLGANIKPSITVNADIGQKKLKQSVDHSSRGHISPLGGDLANNDSGRRRNEGFSSNSEKKINVFQEKNGKNVDLRWKLDEKGNLRCPSDKPGEDKTGLCMYMEKLVNQDILVRLEEYGGYRLNKGKKWPTKSLKIALKSDRIGQLAIINSQGLRNPKHLQALKAHQGLISNIKNPNYQELPRNYSESNILQNAFVRVSIVGSLVMGIIFAFFLYFKFTPFGSYVGKIKKRKNRHRHNLAVLHTQGLSKRFIKRTYRHSNRRRFSVVNIEE